MKTNRISVLGNSSVGGFYLAPVIALLCGPVQLILKLKGIKPVMKLLMYSNCRNLILQKKNARGL